MNHFPMVCSEFVYIMKIYSILFKEYDRVVYVYYWDKVKMEISRYTSTRKRRIYRLRNKDSKGLARIQKIRWFFQLQHSLRGIEF